MNVERKLRDRSDASKWAHPEIAESYAMMAGMPAFQIDLAFNQDLPKDERVAQLEAFFGGGASGGSDEAADIVNVAEDDPSISRAQIIHVPGCPEEPETEAELYIYRPTETKKSRLPVVFNIPGGGMYACMIGPQASWRYADFYDCVVATPKYRTVLGSRYPAALNDMHAGYQYVVEHAGELGIDPDRIVLTGSSSGSNLALSLAFRLKRYGYRPRGCVTECSFTDYRPFFATSKIDQGGSWDSESQLLAAYEYLGWRNLATADDPEMFPNLASVDDCVGLCPIFLHADAEEPNSGSNAAFIEKLSKAGVYNELHVWGGSNHALLFMDVIPYGTDEPEDGYSKRYYSIVQGNIRDCLKYDLRRLWIQDAIGE